MLFTAVGGTASRYELCELRHGHDDTVAPQPEWRPRLQRVRTLLQAAQREYTVPGLCVEFMGAFRWVGDALITKYYFMRRNFMCPLT